MPAGTVTYSTLASSPGQRLAALTGPFTIPTADLLPGNNVLAVNCINRLRRRPISMRHWASSFSVR